MERVFDSQSAAVDGNLRRTSHREAAAFLSGLCVEADPGGEGGAVMSPLE